MKDFYKDKNKRSRYNYERWYIVVRVKSIMNYYVESYNAAKSLTSRHCVEEILNAKIKRVFLHASIVVKTDRNIYFRTVLSLVTTGSRQLLG